jgi:hypothetical protein
MIPGFFYARLGREVHFLTTHISQLITAVIFHHFLLFGDNVQWLFSDTEYDSRFSVYNKLNNH